jgi:hypothetical protein
MPFSINEFVSSIGQGNVSKITNFSVLVTPPKGMQTATNQARQITMRCDAMVEPGRNVLAAESDYHYGPLIKKAYGSSFSDCAASIILSDDYREKIFFEQWQDIVVGNYRTLGTNLTSTNIATDMFDCGYFEDYKGGVSITRYDELGNATYQLDLVDAWPIIVGDINLSWSEGDQIAKMGVTFSYSYYKDQVLNATTAAS